MGVWCTISASSKVLERLAAIGGCLRFSETRSGVMLMNTSRVNAWSCLNKFEQVLSQTAFDCLVQVKLVAAADNGLAPLKFIVKNCRPERCQSCLCM